MALSANRELSRYVDQGVRSYAVAGSTQIYKGGFVGLDASGYARPLVAGDTCVGLAYEASDNSSGSDGDTTVRVFTQGDFEHALASAALTDIGAVVYASDDATLTLTATANSLVGVCMGLAGSNTIIVRLDPHRSVAA